MRPATAVGNLNADARSDLFLYNPERGLWVRRSATAPAVSPTLHSGTGIRQVPA